MSGLRQQLSRLEGAGLISLGQFTPELEYLFRHALVQDAAYASLLRADRKQMHQAVGEALERLYPDRLAEIAPHLGHHFAEAGDDRRALNYFTEAAERASATYATAEAVAYYSRALQAAERAGLPAGALHRARGVVHETLGDFERARADFEAALGAAETARDRQAEWEALLDLGMLWAGRDYRRAGEYYHRAEAAAATLGDQRVLARTLNRVGNWHVNIEEPHEARRLHQAALAIFRALGDQGGVAETLDLLGMASLIGSDVEGGQAVFCEVIPLLEAQDQPRGLASSLAGLGILCGGYQIAETFWSAEPRPDALASSERAIAICRSITWRAGECFALLGRASAFGVRGRYGQALAMANEALAITLAIDHLQWRTYADWLLCQLHLDIGALDLAREFGEHGLVLARSTGSMHWLRNLGAALASTAIAQGDLDRAAAVLTEASPDGTPMISMGQRMCWLARARLSLARGDAALALRLTNELVAPDAETGAAGPIPFVDQVRAEALLALGRPDEAETVLRSALALAERHGIRSVTWRLHAALTRLSASLGRSEAARWHAAIVRSTTAELAASLDNETLRQGFLAAVEAQLATR